MPTVIAEAAVLARVNNGAVLDRSELRIDPGAVGPWAVMADQPSDHSGSDSRGPESDHLERGRLVAIYIAHRGLTVKPAFVLGS
jgi:hypothetical protein